MKKILKSVIFFEIFVLLFSFFPNLVNASSILPKNCLEIFPDVNYTIPECQYIEFLYQRGVINGYSDGLYRPYETLSRGQMAKVMVMGFGLEMQNQVSNFPDVDPTNKFYQYIRILKSRGISSGFSDGTYRPDIPITREQYTKVLYLSIQSKYLNLFQDTINDPIPMPVFVDVPTSNVFYFYIDRLYSHGILEAFPVNGQNYFYPHDNIQRKDAAEYIAKAMNYIQQKTECEQNGHEWGTDGCFDVNVAM